jgi:hypothetical protein
MFCLSLFVLLYFFFWPLCCLFFDIRILIVPLVSLNLLVICVIYVNLLIHVPVIYVLYILMFDRVKPKTLKLVFVGSPLNMQH